jgi:hypothetical protein
MSSQGFLGITSARYFPFVTTPLPPLQGAEIKTGMDVLNQYVVSVGAGATSSTFFAPYTKKQIAYTSSTYDLCEAYQNLKLVMGLVDISLNLVTLLDKQAKEVVFIEVVYTYSYDGATLTERAVIAEGEYTSSPVYLPLPAIEKGDAGEIPCGALTLGVVHIPVVIYLNKPPVTLYKEINQTSPPNGSGSLPVSAYVITDTRFLDEKIDTKAYAPILSDVNSTLKKKFSPNPLLLGSVGSQSGKTFDVSVIGGFSAAIQYRNVFIGNGLTTIGQSLPNTLGSVLLQIA